jgi:NAD+ kinase
LKNRPTTLRRIGLIANPEKADCRDVVERAAVAIRATGRSVAMDPDTMSMLGWPDRATASARRLSELTDLILVFGGDGTMLRVARAVAGSGTPILGINAGGLGFLTAAASDQVDLTLDHLWAGNVVVESRPLLEATLDRAGQPKRQLALNDFVISRSQLLRLIEIDVCVDGIPLTCYRGDGLIVSSPTGSTAYSLAAGGPAVTPDAQVIVLTPICPHTLSNRSVIVSLRSTIRIQILASRVETFLSADGQVQLSLTGDDTVLVRRSPKSVRLARLASGSFFETLRQKLKWSGSTA